jgi:hypothetical protein
MSDQDMRKQVIKLAYENKEIRPLLLPLLKEASGDWLEQKVKNPDTGNMVKVKSLKSKPTDSSAYKLYQQIAEKQKGEKKDQGSEGREDQATDSFEEMDRKNKEKVKASGKLESLGGLDVNLNPVGPSKWTKQKYKMQPKPKKGKTPEPEELEGEAMGVFAIDKMKGSRENFLRHLPTGAVFAVNTSSKKLKSFAEKWKDHVGKDWVSKDVLRDSSTLHQK